MTTHQRVALIGCGNIGFRHLQALCAMQTAADITVVEPAAVHAERIRAQFADAAGSGSASTFQLVARLPDEPSELDLVVIATTAEHRRAAVEDLLARHRVRVLILEKVLFPAVADLGAVGALVDRLDVTTFVNCGRRTFAGYHALRAAMSADRPVHVTVDGHNLGLASNAIHFLDLAEFLNESPLVSVDLGSLDPGSVPARRPGCVEIYGTVRAGLANGATLELTSLDRDPVQVRVRLCAGTTTADVDELARTVASSGTAAPSGAADAPAAFAMQNVSETVAIYDDALHLGTCELTPYADSARQHRLFLRALRAHLGLADDDAEACPIS